MLQTVPVLRIFDLAKARDFYLDFLGFSLDWTHQFEPGFPYFLQVSRSGCVLHLSEHHGDASPGASLMVRIRGLDAYHAEVTSRGYRFMRPGIQTTPWNAREMEVIDPFGNKIRFSEANP